MSDVEAHGPVDFVLIEFPPDAGLGPTADALLDLVDRGTVRLYDVVAVGKSEDGSYSLVELARIGDGAVGVEALSGARSGLLSDDDVSLAADAMEPGTMALLIVYENTWAAPFVAAAVTAGGQMIASQRIPASDVIDALDAVEAAG